MSHELRELYQQLIIDHGRHPRNFGELTGANHIKEGYNPLCGDQLVVYLKEENGVVREVKFTGAGCAISVASASLMTEALTGKTLQEARQLFNQFHALVTGQSSGDLPSLNKLMVLAGVAEFPARVKCATLAWHVANAALNDDPEKISTE